MTQLILNDDQIKTVNASAGRIELRDEQGNMVGYVVRPLSDKVIDQALRRLHSDGPWHTTEQVIEHLLSQEQA